ncbi:MAG: DUF721 domain-containing protein [Candidatus Omnitrophica bacterium]|nr:DUF721 domain-containing protein [Candidatus Omnitrophota bacterium]
MEAIQATLKTVIQTLKARRAAYIRDNPERLLKKVFPRKALSHIKRTYFYKGVLTINVDSSAWLYHLSLQKEDVLEKIHKESHRIKDIRFCLG